MNIYDKRKTDLIKFLEDFYFEELLKLPTKRRQLNFINRELKNAISHELDLKGAYTSKDQYLHGEIVTKWNLISIDIEIELLKIFKSIIA